MKSSGEQELALSRQLLFVKPQSLRQATDIADNYVVFYLRNNFHNI